MNEKFDWQSELINTWNDEARDWDQRSEKMWEQGSRKAVIPFVERYFKPQAHVLDVGCGSGYGSSKLDELGYDVVGIDISDEMVRIAQEARKENNIIFQQADVNNLPFEDATFDALLSINVIEWTKVPAKTMSEMTRVLKRDGLLCAGILGPTAGPRQHSYERIYGKEVVQNTMMPWEFLRLAKEYGYELVAQQGVWKREMGELNPDTLPIKLQQAISFMWLFMLRKSGTK